MTPQGPTPTAAEEWRNGWTLVFACFLGFFYFSIMSQSLGVFMEPLGEEFGWSRTLISTGLTISAATTAVLSPFFGILIDRFGPRRVALPGLFGCAIAISSFSLANGSAAQWIALWVLYAVIAISVKTTVWTAAVVGRFTTAQGLALGVMLTGTAAAQVVLPPLTNWLIESYGWRGAYLWLGCGFGVATFIPCWFFLHDGRDRSEARAGRNPGEREVADLPGLTISQAWRDPALLRIAVSTFVMMLLSIGLMIHQVPVLVDAGVTRGNAAWLASLAGVAGIAGKLVAGVLLDRYRANWVGGLTLVSTALAFLLLIDGLRSPTLIVVAMLVNGYSAGSKLQIASYLVARYGGLRNFGVIYGALTSLVSLGSGLGPTVAGLIYDRTGSYDAFLIAGTVGSILCGLLILTLPPYPDWKRPQAGK